MYMIDLGLSRDLFKGKGTLTISVRDLLNSRKYRGIMQTEDYYSESSFQWRTRQVTATLTYRINQKKDRERGGDREGGENGDGDFGEQF